MKKLIFKNAWTHAQRLAKQLGGKSIEYISYCLKLSWRLARIQALRGQLSIIKYSKKEDNYQGNYFVLGSNLKEKTNKQGESYLNAVTYKGYRNYKFYQVETVRTLKEWTDKAKQLLVENWQMG